jgi:hypothetical protein
MLLLADRISTDVIRNRRFLTNDWTTPQIAQLLPAMGRFVPEFILVRSAM